MIEYKKRVTSQEDSSEDIRVIRADLDKKAGGEAFDKAIQSLAEAIGGRVTVGDLEGRLSGVLWAVNDLQTQLRERVVFDLSDEGLLTIKERTGRAGYSFKIFQPGEKQIPPSDTRTIHLTRRSDFETLEAQVASLTKELKELRATNTIWPIEDSSMRCEWDFQTMLRDRTIRPQYGDWILASDTANQEISFAGLKAEIGRSIYIQTRKEIYLLANRHAFYGLPGDTRHGIRADQMLSPDTTYRFLRASSDSWFVTASSSPYPRT